MVTLFLYGTSLPGQPDHGWVAGLPARPATVRGVLWRTPTNRPALQPSARGTPIHGVLVEIEEARLRVLDLVETAGQDILVRAPVRAASSLRIVEAQAWVLPSGSRRPPGWRRIPSDRFTLR